jgi:hypothetical protein
MVEIQFRLTDFSWTKGSNCFIMFIEAVISDYKYLLTCFYEISTSVILDKLYNIFKFLFIHLWNGNKDTYLC